MQVTNPTAFFRRHRELRGVAEQKAQATQAQTAASTASEDKPPKSDKPTDGRRQQRA